MAVLISVEVRGQTPEGYDGMKQVLEAELRKANGFIMHSAYTEPEGAWRVLEMWATVEDANRFFAQYVAPNLPPGVRPKRQVHQLHSLVSK